MKLVSVRDPDFHIESHCMCGYLLNVNVQTQCITQLIWPWEHWGLALLDKAAGSGEA